MERLRIELLTQEFKLDLLSLLCAEKNRRFACEHIDCVVMLDEGRRIYGETARDRFEIKGKSDDYTGSFRVRVIAGDETKAPGYASNEFGAEDFPKIFALVSDAIELAYRRAMASASAKSNYRAKWGPLGETLWSTELALPRYATPLVDSVPAVYKVDPRTVSFERMASVLEDAARLAGEVPRINYQELEVAAILIREVIAGTNGVCIDQTFAITQAFAAFFGEEKGVQQLHYDFLAHQRGWEIMEEGVNEPFTKFPPFRDFSLNLALDVSELCIAPPCPTVDNAVVVTEPHYNTLKVHEIVGHPTELDRILKMETGYAGRSHFWRNREENMIGKQVASPLVSAYSDPNLPGYGYYKYDHEGVRGQKVVHIEQGILREFMSSAQTAAIFGIASNGHFRAASGEKVPLIRMSNTVFAPGYRNPEDIIREIDRGYYVTGHNVPSIAESRENFQISARKVYEIRNGEVGRLYRDGKIEADTIPYLMSIDAVGNDFRLYPVPNCGKGVPMQTKKLGNGGPTMRGRARLRGPAEA